MIIQKKFSSKSSFLSRYFSVDVDKNEDVDQAAHKDWDSAAEYADTKVFDQEWHLKLLPDMSIYWRYFKLKNIIVTSDGREILHEFTLTN